MSRLHRSASARMSRPAVTIRRHGGWTFGSPSVLMMFHRQPGQLDRELAEMDDCMPHYYKITDGHGQGAERIMRAEAAFLQGRIVDAQIELERAYAQIHGNGQENMALCCDFLAWRLSLCTGEAPRRTMAQRRQELLRQHNAAWLHILDATAAYYGALTGETEEIPPVFREHRLASLSLLAPGRPMLEMIDNQVLLAQGAWAKVIGRSAALLETCAGYALRAGGIACPSPDGGGLCAAGQAPGGAGAAGPGAGRRRKRRLRAALCGKLPLSEGTAAGASAAGLPVRGYRWARTMRSAAATCCGAARPRRPSPC